jgi:hypothetical protein
MIELTALTSTDAAGDAVLKAYFPVRLDSKSTHATAIRDRAPFNVADGETDPRLSDASRANARRGSDWRSARSSWSCTAAA